MGRPDRRCPRSSASGSWHGTLNAVAPCGAAAARGRGGGRHETRRRGRIGCGCEGAAACLGAAQARRSWPYTVQLGGGAFHVSAKHAEAQLASPKGGVRALGGGLHCGADCCRHLSGMDAIEPWAAVSDARVLHQQLRSNSSRAAMSETISHARSEPSLGTASFARQPGKQKRRESSNSSRLGLPAISSPETTGTPAFAMLQAKTAVSQVRSLARLSSEKNEEIIKFGEHVNTELRALRKRMETQRQDDAKHETLEHRVAKAAGAVDDMREELSQLAQKRQKKTELLVGLTDDMRGIEVTVKGINSGDADSPDAVRLGIVKAKYENVEAERTQMVEYSRTLDTLHRRARNACRGLQKNISQLQVVINEATGEIDSMQETLRLLQAVHISTNNERNQYLKSLVMDKMVHAEQLKMRQRMISMERQVDIDNKTREAARVQELNRPKEKTKRKQLTKDARLGFERKALAKVRAETKEHERSLQSGMRRLEVETGITSADEFVSRWEQRDIMSSELQSTAVGTKRRLHEVKAEKERLDEALEALTIKEDRSAEETQSSEAAMMAGSATIMASYDERSARLAAAENMVSIRTAEAATLESLTVRVRETLLGLLLRVCPRETRSTSWAAAQWDSDPIDVVNEIAMIVHAMGTEVCDGEMPTQEYVDSQIGEKSEWKSVIASNTKSDDFQKYNTRVAPINLHHGNDSCVKILSDKVAHAPTAVVAEDHRAHFGRGDFKVAEILAKARAAGIIEEHIDKDPYGMRMGTKQKKKHRKTTAGATAVCATSVPSDTAPSGQADADQEPTTEYVELGGPDFEV